MPFISLPSVVKRLEELLQHMLYDIYVNHSLCLLRVLQASRNYLKMKDAMDQHGCKDFTQASEF